MLPSNYSHLQIIKEKIDVVLTVYGSVSYEYPFFNLYKYYVNNFNMHNFEKKKKLFLDFINSKEYRIRT